MATVNVESPSKIKYDDVDLSEYSDDELEILGLSAEEIAAIKNEPEADEDDEEEDEDEDESQDEDEDSEDEEEGEDEEEDEEPEPKRREPRIPKSRFDEAVRTEREKAIRAEERAKYLEEQVQELLAMKQELLNPKKEEIPEPEFDFDAAETEYAELLISGEIKDAAAVRRKIEKAREAEFAKLLKAVTTEAKKEAKNLSVSEKKDIVVTTALAEYPFLNDSHEDFDADLVTEINMLAAGYESKGMDGDKALQKALDRLAKPMKKVSEAPKKKSTEATKKKMAAMKKQPPKTTGSKGVKDKSADSYDWENMTQKEFDLIYKKHPDIVKEAMSKGYA
jgi:hypothetical protein